MKILTLVDYYSPGYRAGGPIKTIENMVERLGAEHEFRIVTRDRDIGSSKCYEDVLIDDWNQVGNALVYYASPQSLSWYGLRSILNGTDNDILYLNSFFSFAFTTLPLLLRLFHRINRSPTIIAPRGEFSPGALTIKRARKKLYVKLVRALRLYGDCHWQASSEREEIDIRNAIGKTANGRIFIAPDLLPRSPGGRTEPKQAYAASRKQDTLRLVFLSRVSPMKNLSFLLAVLRSAKSAIHLTIYGPAEDASYWAECQASIRVLPSSVRVEYRGHVFPHEVHSAFSEHDVFFFPTLGENFGHVIFEALAAGTCVVLSDQTPWKSDSKGAVEIIPLADREGWINSVERWASFSRDELAARRNAALEYARTYVEESSAVQQNRNMLIDVMSEKNLVTEKSQKR